MLNRPQGRTAHFIFTNFPYDDDKPFIHRDSMTSSGGGIGSTLTAGIQDIAAILPLLGTEQCSIQVSSALTRGYIYAAATPMSIFGSLGMVTTGFKTLVACFKFGDIEGARILGNIGFEPQGENLSLIMVEASKGKTTGRYVIEIRMDEWIKELNLDKKRIIKVSHNVAAWNVKMMLATALLCTFSITPYVYINQGPNSLKKSTTWVFPIVRATGGFTTATLIQLLIQRRITTLADHYLVKRDQLPNADVEAAVEPGETKKHEMDARTWLLLCFLLFGLVASIVGYVGCFSVVQNSTSKLGPVSWFCLESGLSVIRLVIWGWNPTRNGAPPLEYIFELDKIEDKPLPTCNKDNEEILESKVLPLTRARDFLKIITSFAGLTEPFSNPDLSLYYTLTRKRPSKKSDRDRDTEHENPEKHKLGEWTLYITVFDHKERTSRVYTRDNETETFYSTKSAAPLVDVGRYLLEVEIDVKIDPKRDPVFSDSNNLDSLRKHHWSIIEHIRYRLGLEADDATKPYAIKNSWTMKAEDTIRTLQKLIEEENGDDWKRVVEKGRVEEQNEESLRICDYFNHASIEKDRRLLDERLVKWKARRMETITVEMKEMFQGKIGVEYRVDKQVVEKKPATKSPVDIKRMLCLEHYLMELLLLYEVKEWELLFWTKLKRLLEQFNPEEVKERLKREWKGNSWKRLNTLMHATQKRWANIDKEGWYQDLGKRWASSIVQVFEGVEQNPISLSELRPEPVHGEDETRRRMEKEIEDTKFRLKRGSDLDRFDQFWDYDTLFDCRYSRSKWLYLSKFVTTPPGSPPLDIYSQALKENENIIHITFAYFDSDSDVDQFQAAVCDLPWVRSISLGSLPTIHPKQACLFIKSTDNDLIAFAEKFRLKLDSSQDSTYIFTEAERTDMAHSDKLGNDARVLISFVAPTLASGQSLILRLKHSGGEDGPLEVTLGSNKIQLNPSSKSSLTIDDLTLHPIQTSGPPKSDRLSFKPGIRNDIIIQFRGTVDGHGHFLHDIELLDEAGLEEPKNQIIDVDCTTALS